MSNGPDRELAVEPAASAGPSRRSGEARGTPKFFDHAVFHQLRWMRSFVKRHPLSARAYRITIGLVGTAVVIIGVILIPYPGPGWLVVFTGLGILSTEFAWARRVLKYGLSRYHAVRGWYSRQHVMVRLLGVLGTVIITAATLWFFGVLGFVAGWFGIDWPWLEGVLM
ncbi:TIGR02611 family protein [Hoyosella sp. YIM 151337]|uniref:TIGR02611 family protein n=1 Tax=Hoyosella sp. YIM 151337 TaxID=2992742 RepID=UPI0022366597|nr:TIGR02611 family protein [Hoyosella sp. YIM 151337]MCW4353266.1 TIGR02611 family protein [Hoyosella sp. YIM 151337]